MLTVNVGCNTPEHECPLYDELLVKGFQRYTNYIDKDNLDCKKAETPPAIVSSHFAVSAMMTCPLYNRNDDRKPRNLIEDDRILDCPMSGNAAE